MKKRKKDYDPVWDRPFDPDEMQARVEKLIREGRMPTLQNFLESMRFFAEQEGLIGRDSREEGRKPN